MCYKSSQFFKQNWFSDFIEQEFHYFKNEKFDFSEDDVRKSIRVVLLSVCTFVLSFVDLIPALL